MLRLEFAGLVQKLHDLVEVEEGLGYHLHDVILCPVQVFDVVEYFRGNDVFFVRLLDLLSPELELTLDSVAENLRVLRLPALKTLLLGIALAVNLKECEQFLEEAIARELERRRRSFRSA